MLEECHKRSCGGQDRSLLLLSDRSETLRATDLAKTDLHAL
jgi:hypothetical protein